MAILWMGGCLDECINVDKIIYSIIKFAEDFTSIFATYPEKYLSVNIRTSLFPIIQTRAAPTP